MTKRTGRTPKGSESALPTTGAARRNAAEPTSKTLEIIARIRTIPEGYVSTYGQIDPRAPRAVGRVLATTHEGLPWHRVVRADGSLPMGSRQRALLLREQVPMRGDRVDLRQAHFRGW
ncbi:MAG TPA: MGMT family protein [Candidatus Dormibacteraeota bacterium]|nr:MGMT family protein [Candidatus Dormibacteraeota bacterium]